MRWGVGLGVGGWGYCNYRVLGGVVFVINWV